MARAAVIPPSPANRAGRTSTKSTAAADAKKKTIRKATPSTRTATKPTNFDSDDTDDELGFVAAKPAKSRGRPPGRPAARPKATSRGKKATPEPVAEESKVDGADEDEIGQQNEAPKKRPGRPRKNQTMTEVPVTKPETAPKPRGRPRAGTTSKAPTTRETAASNRKLRDATEATEDNKPNKIRISTNSTTMRSNLLRGPAKKKTVTFQDMSESESEEGESNALTPPAAGRKRAVTKATGAGKAGLKANPVRRAATPAKRGRKPAVPKNPATKPLSPKKTKQIANTLSAYTSSDGEDDELNTLKDDIKSPVKLVVHSPVKHGLETTGLSSPVRKINFTPKKASSFVDENGEPKLPTPKHGSEGFGLSSPVRRINFTPNRSQHTVADNGHLSLPPGKTLDFSDSMFMSSPARRPPPTSSPFKFSLRDSQRGGSLFQDSANPNGVPDFTPGLNSPLKSSPKKGRLGASLSQSQFKASTPAVPARTPLFQSPAKRMGSPLKSSIFSTRASVAQSSTTPEQATPSRRVEPERATPKYSPRAEEQDQVAIDKDSEMVEDVARDIFGIELSFEKTSSESPLQANKLGYSDPEETDQDEIDHASTEMEIDADTASEAADYPQDVSNYGYEEPETLCFDAMEEAELADRDLYDEETEQWSGSEHEQGPQAQAPFEYEEADTVCFDALEDAEMRNHDYEEVRVAEIALEEETPWNEEESSPEDQTDEEETQDLVGPESPNLVSESGQMSEIPVEHFNDEASSPSKLMSDSAHNQTVETNDVQEKDDARSIIYNSGEEEQSTGQVPQTEGTEYSPIRPFTFELSSPEPASPDVSEGNDIGSPLQRMYATPSPAPMSPVGSSTPLTTDRPANTENDDPTPRAGNANLGMSLSKLSGPSPSFQADSPMLMAPSLFNTPSVVDQHQSPLDASLGFTPLAQKFGRWETNTPSQTRSLRPRRRGVFSLVGPLDRTHRETPVGSGAVSYPDLSKSPLANTPSLFAELPLQPQCESGYTSPEQDPTPRPSAFYEDNEMTQSPSKRAEIFEDPDVGIVAVDDQEQTSLKEHMPTAEPQFQEQEHPEEDKENCESNILPATPMKVRPEEMRTVHTVSKVPLKAEGEVSPIKLSRKRGLSLSNMSPTRSSPRVRKPTFMAPEENVPNLSPTRRHSRGNRSPSPKRRSSTARRSSGKSAVIPLSSEKLATQSPAKKARRSMSTSQSALHGAVVHVDVHTTEGEDASGIFVELLQQMGARCVKYWSWTPSLSSSPSEGAEPKDSKVGITHVVYKDGGLRTLEKVKKARGLVKCVGVGWVLDCERENQWLDETPYAVDSSIIPRGGAKRRKSMEPRALSNVNGTLVRISESPAPSASGRRTGADQGAVDGFRKITPPTHQQEAPSTPTRQSSTDDYQFPATPGYNFANLDAIGMSPATPYFLSNRSKLVQQSCPPKQSNRGLFPGAKPSSILEDEDDDDPRRKQRFRMEAARRKSLVHKPAVASPLRR